MTKMFGSGLPSVTLVSFIKKMQSLDYEFLTEVIVDTTTKKVTLVAGKLKCIIDCEIGKNGACLHEDSEGNDGKTPICKTKVRHIDMPTENINFPNSAVFTKTTEQKINLGPCFICLYITLPKTNEVRGIGIHGSADDKDGLQPTDGCIRLLNADLMLIRKYFFKNLNVVIK